MKYDKIREHVSKELKGDKNLHFGCTSCGVGINEGEETFILEPTDVRVLCNSCAAKTRRHI